MRLVDLTRDIYHKMDRIVTHPPITMVPYGTHKEVREAEGIKFSAATTFITMGDHAGTHVDAPCHFDPDPNAQTIDQMPLEKFFTEAVCLDFSHLPPKSDISAAMLEEAEQAAGVEVKAGDTVLINLGHHNRYYGTPEYMTDFSGLTRESTEWLGNKGVVSFGVDAVMPGRPGKHQFEVHIVCREMGFTHMESLMNLDKLVGEGRFRFIGFPLKIKDGTGSPIRAVAWLND